MRNSCEATPKLSAQVSDSVPRPTRKKTAQSADRRLRIADCGLQMAKLRIPLVAHAAKQSSVPISTREKALPARGLGRRKNGMLKATRASP